MKVEVFGPGAFYILLIDSKGETIINRNMEISGSKNIYTVFELDLAVQTIKGIVPVIPVFKGIENNKQKVLFDNDEPNLKTIAIANEMNCTKEVLRRIEVNDFETMSNVNGYSQVKRILNNKQNKKFNKIKD